MARRLKVFRTAAGFHDALVATPSRKAALAAWGASADLFARGMAEEVTDPALTEEPLAHPGTVIRRSRGSAAEQLAALPPDGPGNRKTERKAKAPPPAPAREPVPRPSRDALDAAQRAIDEAEKAFAAERRVFERRLKALEAERREAATAHQRRLTELEGARDAAAADFRWATKAWRRDSA